MTADATSQLGDEIDSTTEIIEMLVALTGIVGIVANYFQVLGIPGLLTSLFASAGATNSDASALSALSSQLDNVLQLAAANAADIKMAELTTYAINVNSDLVLLGTTQAVDPTTSLTFQKDAIAFLEAASDSIYWTRPFLPTRTFLPQEITAQENISHSWGWYGVLPQPPTQTDIYPMVFDSALALPFFLKAVEAFLAINALLNPSGFDQLIGQYNKSPTDFLPTVATNLQQIYMTVVKGVVKSDVPSADDIRSYLAVWKQVPNLGGTNEPSCAQMAPAPNGFVGANNTPVYVPSADTTMDQTGCSWNGVYGVVDTYGGFSEAPVTVPGRDTSYIVEIFTQDTIGNLPHQQPYLPDHDPYRWVRDRVTLGLMARWKTLYIALGGPQAWSILQNLRLILNEPADALVQLPDGTVASENWSARELVRMLQLQPLWAQTYPDYVEQTWYSVFHLVQRFDLIARGTWVTPLDDDGFDADERLNRTVVTQRPVSFRERLAAAAV